MAQIQGQSANLNLGFESAFGVEATVMEKARFTTADLDVKQPLNDSSEMSNGANPSKPFRGFKDGQGSIEVPIDTKIFGLWMKAFFGAPTTTGAGPYEHVYKISSTIPSVTFETEHTDSPNLFYRNVGFVASNFSISFGGDGELLMSMSWIGKDGSKETTQIAVPTDNTDGTKFEQFQACITGADQVETISLDYDNGLDGSSYVMCAQGARGGVPKGKSKVSGTFSALFMNDTLVANARDGVNSPLTITLTGTGNDIIEFKMLEVALEVTNQVPVTQPEGLKKSFPYSAYLESGADASAITVKITNDIASYA